MSLTPVNPSALGMYDGYKAVEAVTKAWAQPGTNPQWHYRMQAELRRSMPLLARALDRLAYGDQFLRRMPGSRYREQ